MADRHAAVVLLYSAAAQRCPSVVQMVRCSGCVNHVSTQQGSVVHSVSAHCVMRLCIKAVLCVVKMNWVLRVSDRRQQALSSAHIESFPGKPSILRLRDALFPLSFWLGGLQSVV